jgi:transposase InsO family protein
MATRYSVTMLCRIAEVSRCGYYKWKAKIACRTKSKDGDTTIKEHILAIHRLHPYYGYIRMRTALRKEGLLVNQKKVRRLMRELGIRSVIRRKRPFVGRKSSIIFANVLARKFTAKKPREKLVTDITYIRVSDTFVYLSVVLDLYNNEVISWELSNRNDFELVKNTIRKLDAKGAILHSDQGYQYTSRAYVNMLKRQEWIGSHFRRGNCFDNACIESLFCNI